MKGISLPINLIVVIALAVIVLLGVAAFFMGGFTAGTVRMTDTQAWNDGCATWRMRGCKLSDVDDIKIQNYDPDGDGEPDSLAVACSRVFGYPLGDATTPNSAYYGSEGGEGYNATLNPCWAKCCGFIQT